jgi:hypothetical protein
LLAADGSAAETQLLTKDELATVVLARVAAYLGGPLAGPST